MTLFIPEDIARLIVWEYGSVIFNERKLQMKTSPEHKVILKKYMDRNPWTHGRCRNIRHCRRYVCKKINRVADLLIMADFATLRLVCRAFAGDLIFRRLSHILAFYYKYHCILIDPQALHNRYNTAWARETAVDAQFDGSPMGVFTRAGDEFVSETHVGGSAAVTRGRCVLTTSSHFNHERFDRFMKMERAAPNR